MSNLTARLRESIKACRSPDRATLLCEAAYEIELLRRERDATMEDYRRLSARWDTAVAEWAAETRKLHAIIDAMRARVV